MTHILLTDRIHFVVSARFRSTNSSRIGIQDDLGALPIMAPPFCDTLHYGIARGVSVQGANAVSACPVILTLLQADVDPVWPPSRYWDWSKEADSTAE